MDIIGKKFGRLTVVRKNYDYIAPSTGRKKLRYECKCECGNISYPTKHKLTSGDTISCGCYIKDRIGNKNPSWKGGKYTDKNGYYNIRVGNRYEFEHRHVYEQHHGIKLLPGQNIHHINGNRSDNRIENLELWDTSQPKGQRVEDKIKFYFELVQRYKDHPEYKHLFS
jgi:hypothetical protein